MKKITILLGCLLISSLGYGADRIYPNSNQINSVDCPIAYTGLDNNILGDSWGDCSNPYGDPYGIMAVRTASWGLSGARMDARKAYYFDVLSGGVWVLKGKIKWIAGTTIFGIGGGLTMFGYRIEYGGNSVLQKDLAGSAYIGLPIPTFGLAVLKEFMTAKYIVDTLFKLKNMLTNDYKTFEFVTPPADLFLHATFGVVSFFSITASVGGITSWTYGGGNVQEIYLECVSSGGDCLPPSVSITSPADGATVSGIVTVSANAADTTGVAGVQFKLDGANLGAEDTTAPYGATWYTNSFANGKHALTAVARDAAGHVATSAAVAVNVYNCNTYICGTAAPANPCPTCYTPPPSCCAWVCDTGEKINPSCPGSRCSHCIQ